LLTISLTDPELTPGASGSHHCAALLGDGPPVNGVSVVNPRAGSTDFTFSVLTDREKIYSVESKESLSGANWEPFRLFPGHGGIQILVDTNSARPARFYRVRSW
jgi:hypothetical protein